jgi:tetratricopeptide (TPR) repeat protein
LSQKNNEKLFEGHSWTTLGRILDKTAPPQIDRAIECILKGIAIFHELKIKPHYFIGQLILGKLYLNAGEKDKAVKNIKKAEEAFQEMGMGYWLNSARKILNRL